MNTTTDLRIKKTEKQEHPNGALWNNENPYEEEVFKHFSGGSIAIIESEIPKMVQVAALHGWTVTRVPEFNRG